MKKIKMVVLAIMILLLLAAPGLPRSTLAAGGPWLEVAIATDSPDMSRVERAPSVSAEVFRFTVTSCNTDEQNTNIVKMFSVRFKLASNSIPAAATLDDGAWALYKSTDLTTAIAMATPTILDNQAIGYLTMNLSATAGAISLPRSPMTYVLKGYTAGINISSTAAEILIVSIEAGDIYWDCGLGLNTNDRVLGLPITDGISSPPPNATPSITVLSPNGGETLRVGDTCNIAWESQGVKTVNIWIDWSKALGWALAENVPASQGYFEWIVKEDPGDLYQIWIFTNEKVGLADESDNYFSIVLPDEKEPQRYITLLSPTAGDEFAQGDNIIITWDSAGIDYINIELQDWGRQNEDGSTPFTMHLAAANYPASAGEYSWTIYPDWPTGSLYKIKISAPDNLISYASGYFSIVVGNEGLTIEALQAQINALMAYIAKLQNPALVSLAGPTIVAIDQHFSLCVRVSDVQNFDAGNYTILFSPNVLQLESVEAGNIAGKTIPVDIVNQNSPGTWTIVQNLPGLSGVSGGGYLAQLNFRVIGQAGNATEISFSNGCLGDTNAQSIPAYWFGTTIEVIKPVLRGDVNGDGEVNAVDITATERLIAGLEIEVASETVGNGQ